MCIACFCLRTLHRQTARQIEQHLHSIMASFKLPGEPHPFASSARHTPPAPPAAAPAASAAPPQPWPPAAQHPPVAGKHNGTAAAVSLCAQCMPRQMDGRGAAHPPVAPLASLITTPSCHPFTACLLPVELAQRGKGGAALVVQHAPQLVPLRLCTRQLLAGLRQLAHQPGQG